MNSYYLQQLADAIRKKFGTSSSEPNMYQLEQIINEIERIRLYNKYPSDTEWAGIVKKHCPSTSTWVTKGLDNSDLNALLQMAKK